MRAGSSTVTTTGTQLFTAAADGGMASTASVTNRDATNDALVNVAGLHGAGEFRAVKPGDTYRFGNPERNNVAGVFVKSSAATVAIDFSIDGVN